MYVSAECACSVHGGQKRALDTGAGVTGVEPRGVGAGNPGPLEEHQSLWSHLSSPLETASFHPPFMSHAFLNKRDLVVYICS